MKRIIRVSIFWIGLATAGALQAQSANDYFQQGILFEKSFQVEEALGRYEAGLLKNPNHTESLIHASRMLSNLAGRLPKPEHARKKEMLGKARTYAQKSIRLDPSNPQGRLAHIISLGLLSEIATNPREKVANAGAIHDEAVKILDIDSTFSEAYFVLGKWQYELSQLNWMELMACRIFFGGFPESISIEASLHYFDKAIEFNPNSILFLYGQASAQHALGENQKAVNALDRALVLPISEPDDVLRKERCTNLLKQIVQ
jgi:tetratricopeptide (TPR) repeat protein